MEKEFDFELSIYNPYEPPNEKVNKKEWIKLKKEQKEKGGTIWSNDKGEIGLIPPNSKNVRYFDRGPVEGFNSRLDMDF